ncbi:MAG: uroporphyrinogen decarboxylase family protein [Opitutaceae bacterium]|nr:uroporphyrinogen decarboxylase family protein [Opitutaceae bacterium]
MTPRERVLNSLARKPVVRVPFAWGFGPTPEASAELRAAFAQERVDWDLLRRNTDDVVGVEPDYIGPFRSTEIPAYLSQWGIRTRRVSYGAGAYDEIEYSPLAGLENPSDLARHPWPVLEDFDYSSLNRTLANEDPEAKKALRLTAGNPFEIYSWMTGLEEAMANMLVAPDVVVAALDRIVTVLEQRAARCVMALNRPVDLMFCADDVGGQHGLLMSRSTYRDLLQPFHRRLFRSLKQLSPQSRILFHTDGAVYDILPDLIDAGIDVLEAVQTEAAGMDPSRLKAAYGEKIGFHGAISVQQLLPHGSEEQVRRECRSLLSILGAGGGYIAAPSHAIQAGTPARNVRAMLETIVGPGCFEAAKFDAPPGHSHSS